MSRGKKEFFHNDSGAVAVYVALGLVAFLGCAALALDIAHLVSVKRSLVKAAEAGALSGARGLWPMDFSTAASRDPNWSAAETRARSTATKNQVDGIEITTDEVTVEVGRWDYAAKQFTPGNNSNANGVRVTASKASIPMLLAQILGQGSRNMSATAIAVMDFASAVGAGTLPIAINKMYTEVGTPLFINFTPDPLDNGGWFTEASDSASAATFKDYITNATCPPLIKDISIINLQNGQDTSVLDLLAEKLANSETALSDGTKYLDTALPVVDTDKFNQSELVRDFVPYRITSVSTKKPKGVYGTVITFAEMQSALPGGGKVGTLAPPKLVQ